MIIRALAVLALIGFVISVLVHFSLGWRLNIGFQAQNVHVIGLFFGLILMVFIEGLGLGKPGAMGREGIDFDFDDESEGTPRWVKLTVIIVTSIAVLSALLSMAVTGADWTVFFSGFILVGYYVFLAIPMPYMTEVRFVCPTCRSEYNGLIDECFACKRSVRE